MSVSYFNPYQAPAATSDETALAPDTEFLFNDKVVAGTDRIVLPHICIATGATELLLEQEKQLSWCSRWITIGRSISILATMFCAIPMLTHLPPTPVGISSWSEIEALLQIGGGVAIILAMIAFIAASYLFRKSIHVRWYISRGVLKQNFLLTSFVLAIPFMIPIALLLSSHLILIAVVVIVSIGIGIIMRKKLNRPSTPVVVGILDGLFLIGGLSQEFLEKAQRLVDAYVAKDK